MVWEQFVSPSAVTFHEKSLEIGVTSRSQDGLFSSRCSGVDNLTEVAQSSFPRGGGGGGRNQ